VRERVTGMAWLREPSLGASHAPHGPFGHSQLLT
jgi:hypothetical protein